MNTFRFDCVFYYVRDLDRAIRFYTTVLGFQLSSRDTVARFYVDGVLFELVPAEEGGLFSGCGNARLTLAVDAIETATAELRTRGVAVSPSSVWRVLSQAGFLSKWNGKPSRKGTGFAQPLTAHEYWHIDVSYLNIGGTFYYLCSILDGYSRFIVNWDIREAMTEADIEIMLQGAKEKYPEVRPRIISDNGPQFIAKDFKGFIRISGMTHVRTSPFYPQSNGKIERWRKSLKRECIRPGTPLSLDDARRLVQGYVERYNNVRLNSATGFITPMDMLVGRQQEIHAERDQKLEAAREQRRLSRKQAA